MTLKLKQINGSGSSNGSIPVITGSVLTWSNQTTQFPTINGLIVSKSSTPTIIFNNDSNTGFGSSSNDTLELYAGGFVALTITQTKTRINGTSQLSIPSGTTSQRLTGTSGDIRYNKDTNSVEAYHETEWKRLSPYSIKNNGSVLGDYGNFNFSTGLEASLTTDTYSIGLSTTTVSSGSYGSASSVATFTVDSYGRLTTAGTSSIAISGSQITSGTVAIANGGTGTSTTGQNLFFAGQSTGGTAAPSFRRIAVVDLPYSAVSITANYTVLESDINIFCNNTTTITVTLPVASSVPIGKTYSIKQLKTNNVIITVSGSGTIDDNSSITLNTQYSAKNITSDGSNWWIMG